MNKPTPQLVATCLQALTQDPELRKVVHSSGATPANGGVIQKWTDMAYDYAVTICRKCENPQSN